MKIKKQEYRHRERGPATDICGALYNTEMSFIERLWSSVVFCSAQRYIEIESIPSSSRGLAQL
jgi:hypothetical protein